MPLSRTGRRALLGAALGLSALGGWGALSSNAEASAAPGTADEVVRPAAVERPPAAPQLAPAPVVVSAPAVKPEVAVRDDAPPEVVAADEVDGVGNASPSLVRYTPRTRAERVDVWLRFPSLDVRDQLALQDQLPPDFSGPAVELGEHRLRLRGPLPAGSIFWVSQELGFLGEGAELERPELDRAGEVRALFVEQTNDGSVRVRSSRPLAAGP